MFFAKLHPLLVHFPIGLLVTGTLFELYGNFRGEKIVAKAGSFNIKLGFWCSIPVAVIGFFGLMSIELKDEFKPFVVKHLIFICLLKNYLKLMTMSIFLKIFQNPSK